VGDIIRRRHRSALLHLLDASLEIHRLLLKLLLLRQELVKLLLRVHLSSLGSPDEIELAARLGGPDEVELAAGFRSPDHVELSAVLGLPYLDLLDEHLLLGHQQLVLLHLVLHLGHHRIVASTHCGVLRATLHGGTPRSATRAATTAWPTGTARPTWAALSHCIVGECEERSHRKYDVTNLTRHGSISRRGE